MSVEGKLLYEHEPDYIPVKKHSSASLRKQTNHLCRHFRPENLEELIYKKHENLSIWEFTLYSY
jgi:hypothetical protein